MSVVGLDFGSANCVIASAGRGGVDVILNGNSNRLNPGMVAFSAERGRSMGEAAAATASSNYKNTIKNMKRLIGLKFTDPFVQAEIPFLPFKIVESANNGGVSVVVEYEENPETIVPVESCVAMMISHMSSIAADAHDGVAPKDWVIAVPTYYTDAQKRSFLDACDMVNVQCLRLMSETTATALAYGIFKDIKKEFSGEEPTHTMFIDLGASQYSVSIVAFQQGKLSVLSTHTDAHLGGRNFDMAMAKHAAAEFAEKYKAKNLPDIFDRPKAVLKLLAACEKAKKTLSPAGVKEARMGIECLIDGYDLQCTFTNDKFGVFCGDLLARLAAPIERCLEESGLDASQIANVEIVGGGSRPNCVKKAIAETLKLDVNATNCGLSTTMNADEAVARGCALQSAIVSPRFRVISYEIIERQIAPIKISWVGTVENDDDVEMTSEGAVAAEEAASSVIMFERGSNFPSVRRVTLRQSGNFTITASYDDADTNGQAPTQKAICSFNIEGPKESARIRVNVKQDISGVIVLSSAQAMEEVKEDEVKEEEVKEEEKAAVKEGEEATAPASKEGEDGDNALPSGKKKYKKTNLNFTTETFMRFTKAQMDSAAEIEARMANADRVIQETTAKRNELESYIYDMRDKIISESQLASYGTDAEKKDLSAALEAGEEWLYSDEGFDANKSAFAEKLNSMKLVGDVIAERKAEDEGRGPALEMLKKTIATCKTFVNSADEVYAHITDDERLKAKGVVEGAEGWMFDMIEKQGSVNKNQNAVLSVKEVNAKNKEVADGVNPIMFKPRPLPKKEEAKKEETPAPAAKETPEGGEEKSDEGGEQPMDTEEGKSAEGSTEGEPMETSS